MILEFGPNLFRYNISEPPSNWDQANAENTEHNYDDSLGLKNKIGAFFLYDTLEAAQNTGKQAASIKGLTSIWLTRTSIKDKVRVLDFSECKSVKDFIDILDKNEVDVRIKEIILNGMKRNLSELINCTQDTRLFPQEPIELELGYFGQLLTDFENGVIFLNLIEHLNIDGYRWRESPDALTYCLFNSDKLNTPKHEHLKL